MDYNQMLAEVLQENGIALYDLNYIGGEEEALQILQEEGETTLLLAIEEGFEEAAEIGF